MMKSLIGVVCSAFAALTAFAAPLEGWWRFTEEGGATAFDGSSHGREAVLDTNRVWRLDAAPGGGALWFGGVAGTGAGSAAPVTVPSFAAAPISNAFSVSAWVLIDSPVSYAPIILRTTDPEGWSDGFGLFLGVNGTLGAYVRSGTDENAVFGGELSTNLWRHVAATFDGRRLALWVDARRVAEKTLSAETALSAAPLTFGTLGGDAPQSFVGAVADVRVWSAALSESSLAAVYRLFLGEAVDPNADDDGDGLPNGWEVRFKLDPRNPADALRDADGDGRSNLCEYRLGRNPHAATVSRPSLIRAHTAITY